MRILKLTKETQNNILENLLKRSPNSYGEFESRVNDIIQNVREKRYTKNDPAHQCIWHHHAA